MTTETLDINKIGRNVRSNIDSATFEYFDKNGDNQLVKIFLKDLTYTGDKIITKKLKKISSIEEIRKATDVRKLIYYPDGLLAGYTYGDLRQVSLEKYIYSSRGKKLEILNNLKKLVKIAKENNITIGSFDDPDNFAMSENGIILNDPDNFEVDDLYFSNPSYYVTSFNKKSENNPNVDAYGFNIFTIMFYSKYTSFNTTLNGIREEGLPFRFNTSENKEIAKKSLTLSKDYEDKFFIDNMKKTIF